MVMSGVDQAQNPTSMINIEVDVGAADEFLKSYNEKNPTHKLSYTLISVKAISEAFKLPQSLNS